MLVRTMIKTIKDGGTEMNGPFEMSRYILDGN